MFIRYLIIFFLLFVGNAWGADLTCCASGCDGTIADFEAGNAPFDDLKSDTVTFTDATQSATLSFPNSFGAAEGERATLVFTGVTITVADKCIETNGYDYITIEDGTFSGGSGTTAVIEVEANSTNITIDGGILNPNSGNNRLIRVCSGCNYFTLENATLDGQTSTQNMVHFYFTDGNSITNAIIDSNTFSNGYAGTIIASFPGAGSSTLTDWTISGNTFNPWGNSVGDTAFKILWTNASVVHTVTVSGNAFGAGAGRAIHIVNTTDDDTSPAYGIDVDLNTFTDSGHMSIDLMQITSTGGTSYIRRNTVYRPGAAGGQDNLNGIRVGASNGIIIEKNKVSYVNSTSGDGNGIIIDKHVVNSVDNIPSVNCIARLNKSHHNTTQGGGGISAFCSTGTIINNNLCYNNLRGIRAGGNVTQGSSGTIVYGNDLALNTNYGLQCRQYGGDVTVYNNIFKDNDYGVYEESNSPTPTLDYDCWDGNTTADVYDADSGAIAKGSHAVSADPLFVDAASGDFSLQATSPCINKGLPKGSTYENALHPDSTWPDGVTTVTQGSGAGGGWK